MPTPDVSMIVQGNDITDHYLDKGQNEFKIFRYENNVYAVHYNQNMQDPISAVHMWRSHKNDSIEKTSETLGKGVEGIVKEKTPDKVVKQEILKKKSKDPNIKLNRNLEILKQKFILSENHIDQFFIFGLWSTKAQGKDFFMPRIFKRDVFTRDEYNKAFNEFILALKKANELGLSHPDYSNSPSHKSFQNEIFTKDGIRLIDLDKGLLDLTKINDDKYRVYGKDQWLYVYNYKFNTTKEWRQKIYDWYKENPGIALSEKPEILLQFYSDSKIVLPEKVLKELQLTLDPPTIDVSNVEKKNWSEGLEQSLAETKAKIKTSTDNLEQYILYAKVQFLHTAIAALNLISVEKDSGILNPQKANTLSNNISELALSPSTQSLEQVRSDKEDPGLSETITRALERFLDSGMSFLNLLVQEVEKAVEFGKNSFKDKLQNIKGLQRDTRDTLDEENASSKGCSE